MKLLIKLHHKMKNGLNMEYIKEIKGPDIEDFLVKLKHISPYANPNTSMINEIGIEFLDHYNKMMDLIGYIGEEPFNDH